MVAHPHKLQRNDSGVVPPPDLYQVSGSAHWANMADTALVIHRDFENNQTKVIAGAVWIYCIGVGGACRGCKFKVH